MSTATEPTSTPPTEDCDVVVVGGSVTAGTLAVVLAAGGARVTVVEETVGSPFPAGELGMHASGLFRILAERYRAPELAHLVTVDGVREHVTTTVGEEHCHSFLYHREGRKQDPAELLQVCPPKGSPPDPHLYRRDVDPALLRIAEKRGATVIRDVRVTAVRPDADGVTVTLDDGATVRARYLVDTSGPHSPLVAEEGLRQEPTRFATRSRTITTHMTGVRPFGELVADRADAYRSPMPWAQGSTHHLTDGAYLWMVPFGNHKGGDPTSVGVGLTFDTSDKDADGDPGATPEEEFRAFVARFPTLAAQFEKATASHPWTSTERNQYSVSRTVGDRWCLVGDAAGHVDPFIARGLGTALETVNVLAWRLLEAVKDGDFSTERFAPVGEFTRACLDANDELAAMWLAGLKDPALLKAVLFVFEVGFRYGAFPMMNAFVELKSSGSDASLRAMETVKYVGSVFPGHEGFNQLFAVAGAECRAVAEGTAPAGEAADRIFRMVREAEFVPAAFKLDDPKARFLQITPATILRLLVWSLRKAPRDIAPLVRTGIRSVLKGG